MKKLVIAVMLLVSMMVLAGCVPLPPTLHKCMTITSSSSPNGDGVWTPDEITDVIIDKPCIVIQGDNIKLDGQGQTFLEWLTIEGDNNEVYNFKYLGVQGDQALPPAHPAVSVVSGDGNRIHDNEIKTVSLLGAKPSTGIEVQDAATNTYIEDNSFYGVWSGNEEEGFFQSGPSVHILASGTAPVNNVILQRNDFFGATVGVLDESSAEDTFGGNWWSYTVTERKVGVSATKPYNYDVDSDGVAGSDNCPFKVNPNQQDLDNDGLGTPCDPNELDLNTEKFKYKNYTDVIVAQTKDYFWMVIPNAAGVYSGLVVGTLTIMDPHDASLLGEGIGVTPVPFGTAPSPVVTKTGHAGVLLQDYVNSGSCVGDVAAGPFSLTGVGYSYGFNKECVVSFKNSPGTDRFVEFIIDAPTDVMDVYKNWELIGTSGFGCTDNLVTGTAFEVNPEGTTACDEGALLGVVFVSKQDPSKAVRFGLPIVASSGKTVDMTPEQEEAFTNRCLNISYETGNDEEGVMNVCNNATSLPRGPNAAATLGRLVVTYDSDQDQYHVKAYIPSSFIDSIDAETNELSVSVPVTLVNKDGLHMLKMLSDGETGWDRLFQFSGDMNFGSYLPCIATSCYFGPGNMKFHVVDDINLESEETVKNALGLVVQGYAKIDGTPTNKVHFMANNANKPYIGYSALPNTKLEIDNAVFDDSIVGWAILNANVHWTDSDLNTATATAISGATVELRDVRAKFLMACANDGFLLYQNLTDGTLDQYLLPYGTADTEVALQGLLGELSAGLDVGCNLLLDTTPGVQNNLNAGELAGIWIEGVPATISNTRVDAKTGLVATNIRKETVGVTVQNFELVNAQAGVAAAGNLNFALRDSTLTGKAGESFTAMALVLSPQYAQSVLDVGHKLDEIAHATMKSAEITNVQASGWGQSPAAAKWPDFAAKSLVIYEAPEGDAWNSGATVQVTGLTSDKAIAVYGDADLVTSGTTPPVEYPEEECLGTSAINAKVTSNDVTANTVPGQQPLSGARVMAFDRATCADLFPDAQAVVANCPVVKECVTGADGLCTMDCLAAGQYYVVTEESAWPGTYPSHSVGSVADGETKFARLAFLRDPVGKVKPGKTSVLVGSELWIYEPDYVVWDGTEEYYPFIFESPDNQWTIDICVDAPEGYEPVDGIECLQTIVSGEKKSILFKLVEVGSVPGPMSVHMSMIDPHGKAREHTSTVGMRLTDNLAKAKGVAIDKNGRLLGKGKGVGITGVATAGLGAGGQVFGLLLLGLVAGALGVLLYMGKKRN